jgi:hypothetical protein
MRTHLLTEILPLQQSVVAVFGIRGHAKERAAHEKHGSERYPGRSRGGRYVAARSSQQRAARGEPRRHAGECSPHGRSPRRQHQI